ncbi:MAG: hypothetical protein HGB10_01360 [Coriobacteriia bacterium]|nr:hypothetical protein [Coriobacteriia bacterium]
MKVLLGTLFIGFGIFLLFTIPLSPISLLPAVFCIGGGFRVITGSGSL